MNNSRFKLYLIIILVLSGLLPITGSIFLHFFLSDLYWIDEPLHSVVEALGSFIASSLAILILILKKNKEIPSYYMWVSCALIGMGLLDVFHAFSPPGDSFIWLHGIAILIGSFLFAMVWLPDRMAQSRLASILPTIVAVVAIIFGLFAVVFPDTLPSSRVNEGVFTTIANAINILSGFFFLSAAAYFIIRYRSDRRIEDFLFINFCLLNGWAGLSFPFSQLWYADWWFWHLLRLLAYFIVISYVFIAFQRSEAALRESEERYRKLVESSPDAIAVHSEGKIVFTNSAGAKLLGAADPEQIIGKEIMDFVHSDYRETVKERIQQMKEERKDVPLIEEKFVRLDGSVIDVEVAATPFIHQGKHGMQVIVRDITERKQIEEILRERERSYRTLSENLPGIVYRVFLRENNMIQFFNNIVQQMTGYSIGELTRSEVCSLDPLILPDDRERVIATVKHAVMENQPFQVEYRLKHKEGDIRHFLERGRPIYGVDGNPLYIDGVILDFTERKQAEEALKGSKEFSETVINSMNDAISIIDVHDYRIINVNRVFESTYGLKKEDVIGRTCYKITHHRTEPCTPPDDICPLIETLRTGKHSVAEHVHYLKDDAKLYVEVSASPVRNQKGEISQVVHVSRNITKRKRAEEKIREQAALLDKANDAIAAMDLENRIIYWNKGAERLYGRTAKEVIGKNPIEFLFKDKEELPQLIEAKRIVLEKGEWTGELRQMIKDGRELIVESRWTLVQDSKGKPTSILIINTDITEKKKLEAQFLRAQRLESIGTLAGGIAHDINNVLTPMMLSLQLLQEKFTDNESQKLLDILERSAQRGASLVKQVQSFARGVQGERVALQVSHLIYEIMQIAKETFPRSIEIRTDIQKDLWTLSGDATQLHQVMMNLCVNARDAMSEGGILSISAENVFINENYARMNIDAKVGQYVVITVSDTGTGIPSEILDRIFEPFFTTKQPGKGTGLGLSTSLAIVKSHGGFINVYSEVGKEAVFKVYLPVVKTTEVQKMDEQLELLVGHGELILVVDDEAMVRQITSSILETHGYRVLTANDGAEAIKVYTQNREKIKVVLMDMMMPVMDGQACIRALRKVNPDIKIIAVSGLAENGKLAKATVTHVKAFLPKPYAAKRLLKTIHEALTCL